MASKYDGLARIIIQNVGGKQNINSITHCITRLRFKLKDESKANTDILNQTDGVIKVIQANGQYQVVIGNTVGEVYDAVLEVGHLQGAGVVDEDGNAVKDGEQGSGKKNIATVLIDMISGIMAPTITLLGASGIIKGLLDAADLLPRSGFLQRRVHDLVHRCRWFLLLPAGHSGLHRRQEVQDERIHRHGAGHFPVLSHHGGSEIRRGTGHRADRLRL